jgi:hypothetical protein
VSGAAAAPLPSAPAPTQLRVEIGQPNPNGTFVVEGTLTSGGLPVAGVRIEITAAGGVSAQATTSGNGTFTTLINPIPGTTSIVVRWAGNSSYAAADRTMAIVVPGKPAELTVQPDVTSVPPGGVVVVSGLLTTGGVPIADARIDATLSWAAEGQSAQTQVDGTYALTVSAPDDANTAAAGVTITVSFSGEGLYAAVTNTCQVGILKPTIEVSVDPDASPTATPVPGATGATAGPTAVPAITPVLRFGSPLFIIAMIFLVVAALAGGTLLIIALVSRQRRGLAADERRGFGSDFGRPEEGPAGEAGAPDEESLLTWFDSNPDHNDPSGSR